MSAYIHVTGDDYDISWATPQCVLSLRLTGVVFDVYDGKKKQVGSVVLQLRSRSLFLDPITNV